MIVLYLNLTKALTPPKPENPIKESATGDDGGLRVSNPQRKLQEGVEYEYASPGVQPAGEGWERTSGAGWRRPVGSGGGKTKKVETEPLKSPEQQAQKKQIGKVSTSDPFSPNPEDFKNDDPFTHYEHIKTHEAQEGTDPKLTHMHRQLIDEKTKDYSPEDHNSLADQLDTIEMPDEAARHRAVAETLTANAQQTKEELSIEEQAKRLKEKAAEVKVRTTFEKKKGAVVEKQNKIKEDITEHEKTVKAVESNIEEAKKESEALSTQLKEVTTKAEELKTKLEKTVDDYKTTVEAHKSDEDKKHDKESARLQTAHDKATQRLEYSNKKVAQYDDQVKYRSREVDKLTKDINSKARDLLKLETKLTAHKETTPKHGEYKDTETYKTAKKKHDLKMKAIKAEQVSLRSELKKLKLDKTEASQKVKETKGKLSEATKSNNTFKREVSAAEKEVSSHKKKATQTRKPSPKVIKLQEEAASLSAELKEVEKVKANIGKKQEKASKDIETLMTKRDAALVKQKKLKENLDKTTQQLTDLEAERAAAEEKAAAAKQQPSNKKAAKGPGLLAGVRAGFHHGRAAGASVGAAAAQQGGAGSIAGATINYGTSGAVAMGHYLLYPKAKGRTNLSTSAERRV